jgi:signal transduction histidine kinase/CheY-like chemotaxis protein
VQHDRRNEHVESGARERATSGAETQAPAPPSGLRIKVVLVAMVVSLVAALAVLVFVMVSDIFEFLSPEVRRNLVWKTEHGAEELSKTLELGAAAAEPTVLERAARPYLKDEDVLLVLVLDQQGRETMRGGSGSSEEAALFRGAPGRARDMGSVFLAWAPIEIEGMSIGKVGLAVSKQQLLAGQALRRRILFVGCAGALLALAAALAFVNLYIGPLLRMTEDALRRLEHTTALALESARLKSQFLANMSHEIRTPINGVLGITRLMRDLPLDAPMRRYLDALDASGRSLASIIDDILDFSKIEADKYAIQRVEFDPSLVMHEVAEMLATAADAKRIDLVCRVAPDLPARVVGDPDRFRQVLNNLGGNAVKFTQRGEVFIDLSMEPGRQPQDARLRVEVRDTGIGIPDEVKGQVFDAFWQQDGSAARSYGGTGLGLAISKRLVHAMGGELDFVSASGVGSRFYFSLPCVVAEGVRSKISQGEPTGRRALIVDASDGWREVLRERLGSWGMRCATEASGARALDALRAASAQGQPYDVALVASETADLRGEEVLSAIASDSALAGVKLVLLGHLGGDGSRAALLPAVIARLAKPLRASHLYDSIVSAFGAKVPPRAGTSSLQPRKHRRARVLLVEDNEINQFVAVEQLKKLGYEVDVAQNGVEALAAIERGNYAVVLMDCQMPVMDGYTATQEIRKREAPGRHLPVVALTAHALAGEREKVMAAGMDDYLTKPLQPSTLAKLLQRLLDADEPEQDSEVAAPARGSPPLPVGDDLDASVTRSKEICELFLELIPGQIEQLERAVAEGRANDVFAQAHKLKGGTLSIGARRMASVAAELEESAGKGGLSQAPAKMAVLRERFVAVSAHLRDEIAKARPGGDAAVGDRRAQ